MQKQNFETTVTKSLPQRGKVAAACRLTDEVSFFSLLTTHPPLTRSPFPDKGRLFSSKCFEKVLFVRPPIPIMRKQNFETTVTNSLPQRGNNVRAANLASLPLANVGDTATP